MQNKGDTGGRKKEFENDRVITKPIVQLPVPEKHPQQAAPAPCTRLGDTADSALRLPGGSCPTPFPMLWAEGTCAAAAAALGSAGPAAAGAPRRGAEEQAAPEHPPQRRSRHVGGAEPGETPAAAGPAPQGFTADPCVQPEWLRRVKAASKAPALILRQRFAGRGFNRFLPRGEEIGLKTERSLQP